MLILIIIVLYCLSFAQEYKTDNEPAQDYKKIVQFSNLAAVAYCVGRGLSKGRLGDKGSGCHLSACKNDILKDVEIVKIFDFSTLNEVGTGYYALDKKRKTIILVFRGSVSRRDWATDIDFIPTKYRPIVQDDNFECEVFIQQECINCKVHRGFYNFLKDNSGAIISLGIKLKKIYPDYQFLIIGHSLGAAFTTLSGIEFQLLGYDPLVVTYGGPKVGNQEFADFTDRLFDTEEVANCITMKNDFSRGFIRVVHKHDIIPFLPPMFTHAGYKYFIDKKQLPHEECDIDRRGMEYSGLLWKRSSGIRPSTFWPDSLGKYEHTHYFRRITSCRDED